MNLPTAPTTILMHADVPDILENLRHLFVSGDWTDLTILSGVGDTKTFRVHKAILCPRSTYFAHACAATDTITLPERSRTIEDMLEYAYGFPSETLQCADHATVAADTDKLMKRISALMLLYLAVDKYKLSKSLEEEVVKCTESLMWLVQEPWTIVHVAQFLYENVGDRVRDLCCAAARSTHRKLALIMADQRARDNLFSSPSLLQDVLRQEALGQVPMAVRPATARDALFTVINDVIQEWQQNYTAATNLGLNPPYAPALVTWRGVYGVYRWVVDWRW